MPDQQTAVQETAATRARRRAAGCEDEPLDELPPRPRRRLLGAGASPVPLALLGVLLIACGFIAGVLVEKGQSILQLLGRSAARRGLAARFAALRGAAGAGTAARSGAAPAVLGTARVTGAAGGGRRSSGARARRQAARRDRRAGRLYDREHAVCDRRPKATPSRSRPRRPRP